MPQIAVTIQPDLRNRLFTDPDWAALEALGEVVAHEGSKPATAREAAALAQQAEVLICSWGMFKVDQAFLDAASHLKLIVYAAGSVRKWVSEDVWERGVQVVSAAWAIGHTVAEFTLGMMILGRRNAFRYAEAMRSGERKPALMRDTLAGSTVGLVSLGAVGRLVAEQLSRFDLTLLAHDPYIPREWAEQVGAALVDLDELVSESDVVSLHAPALAETRHMIDRRRLKLMKDHAVLINTARGSLVDHAALIEQLEAGRLFACLDVTDPEPAPLDSPLRRLPNVVLTPHIAGGPSPRIGRQCVEEVQRFLTGRPPVFEVTRQRLGHMA